MSRTALDEELRHINDALRALEAVEDSRRVAVLDYLNSRFLALPDERAAWPHELEPVGVSDDG